MRRPRTTIAALVLLVGFCALTFASLRHASLWWSRVMLGVACAVTLLAVFRAYRGSEERRVFRVGFVAVSTTYLLITLSPWLGEWVAPRLPTTRLLERLYPRLCEPREASTTLPRARFDQSFSAWAEAHPGIKNPSFVFEYDSKESAVLLLWIEPALEPFERAGHAAFAVLFGWLGGCAASFASCLVSRRDRTPSPVLSTEPAVGGPS